MRTKIGKLLLLAGIVILVGIGGCKSDFQVKASQQIFYKGENKGQEYKSRDAAGFWSWGRSDSIGVGKDK